MIIDDDTQDQTTIEDLKDFIGSDEFKESINKASEQRLKIINDFTPEMKEIKQEFIDYMIEGSGANSKEEKKEAKKKFSKEFKKAVDYLHYAGGWPKPETKAKLETLAENVEIAIKYFDFMQNPVFKDKLAAHGIYIDESKTKKITDDYPNINPGTKLLSPKNLSMTHLNEQMNPNNKEQNKKFLFSPQQNVSNKIRSKLMLRKRKKK